MSDHIALTIIAAVMLVFLVIALLLFAAIWRTLNAVSQLVRQTEREIAPLIFDLRMVLADVRKLTGSAQDQLRRVDHTVKYVSESLLDVVDRVVQPVQEAQLWSKAFGAGLRYFFRSRD